MSTTETTTTIKTTFPGQRQTETVELVFHQHPIVMRRALIYGLLLVLAGALPVLFWPLATWVWKVFWLGLALMLIYWAYTWVGWYYSVYIITNERLIEIKQKGFFNRRVSEYGLDKVQNVNYHIKGFQAVVFQYGDITAQTYVGDVVMKMIHHPVQIHGQIIDIMRRVVHTSPPGT